jgi:hypothetical protein
MVEMLDLPFPLLSDPDRSGAIEPYGLSDPADRRNLAVPATVVVGPDGTERLRRPSRDYADRPVEDDVLEMLTSLGLPPTSQEPPELGPIEAGPRAIPLEYLHPYFRGGRFAVVAMSRRHPEIEPDAEEYIAMADRYLEAAKAAYRASRARNED